MANLALALDEIIREGKKTGGRGSPRVRGGRRLGGRKAAGGMAMDAVEPRTSARTRFPQRGFVSGVCV